jgi:peptide/nickel transport system permease protein
VLAFAARRLLLSVPILLLSSILVFVFMRATTDPVRLATNPRMSAEQVAAVRKAMGLDRSGPAQYTAWLGSFVRGDWGISFDYEAPVRPIIARRLWNTIKLMALAVTLALAAAVTIGIVSALRVSTRLDYLFTGLSFVGISMPVFWFGLLAQLVLGFFLMQWLGRSEPLFFTGGMHRPGDPTFRLGDFLRHAALPALVLMVQLVGRWSRYQRSSMLEVLESDYLRTARAKGLAEREVIGKHALRNALIPLVTVVGLDIGALFGGLIVTEVIFSWPGMGTLFTEALQAGDYPIVLPWLMVVATLIIAFNLLADLTYGVLDPRTRHG